MEKTIVDYKNLTFEKFQEMALDQCLSRHEKVGFPDSYRDGREEAIFRDISGKLGALPQTGKTILEIGPGCSRLPLLLSELCGRNNHRLIFIDGPQMLSHLPDEPFIVKYAGRYPDILGFEEKFAGAVDAVLLYSVIQYMLSEGNPADILDRLLSLLAEGGEILLGDIPNTSMRRRFFSSPSGARCHREFTGTNESPDVLLMQQEANQIDDSVMLELLCRARGAGFHAWLLPQSPDLPMANRREDILIRKP